MQTLEEMKDKVSKLIDSLKAREIGLFLNDKLQPIGVMCNGIPIRLIDEYSAWDFHYAANIFLKGYEEGVVAGARCVQDCNRGSMLW